MPVVGKRMLSGAFESPELEFVRIIWIFLGVPPPSPLPEDNRAIAVLIVPRPRSGTALVASRRSWSATSTPSIIAAIEPIVLSLASGEKPSETLLPPWDISGLPDLLNRCLWGVPDTPSWVWFRRMSGTSKARAARNDPRDCAPELTRRSALTCVPRNSPLSFEDCRENCSWRAAKDSLELVREVCAPDSVQSMPFAAWKDPREPSVLPSLLPRKDPHIEPSVLPILLPRKDPRIEPCVLPILLPRKDSSRARVEKPCHGTCWSLEPFGWFAA
mmetsp:Transcript_65126/g.155354  ORF Transcript_65126/g.155354 Transcript_65126/m.155354 type:complete len:273 (-) Transcript_65126:1041-1859(-)